MTLVSLTYVSFATREMGEDDLKDILAASRRNNPKQDITGMLLYRDRYFIQALEGEDRDVTALYKKIEKDPRHSNVLLVGKDEINERSFGDWSMGFKNLDDMDAEQLDGYSNYLNEPFNPNDLAENPSRAKTLLNVFRSGTNF